MPKHGEMVRHLAEVGSYFLLDPTLRKLTPRYRLLDQQKVQGLLQLVLLGYTANIWIQTTVVLN